MIHKFIAGILFLLLWAEVTVSSGSLFAQDSGEAETIVEDFAENPFKKYPGEWKRGGNADWTWQPGEIRSGGIGDEQESWVEWTTKVGTGTFRFKYDIDSEENCDFLFFYLNHKPCFKKSGTRQIGTVQGEYSVPLERGTICVKWRYKKDKSQYLGMDRVKITQISYPKPVEQNVEALRLQLIGYLDEESNRSWGNNDRVLQNFETIQIWVGVENTTTTEAKNLSLVAELPDDVFLIVTSTPAILAVPPNQRGSIVFSIAVGSSFQGDKIEFPIHLKFNSITLKSLTFTAPFQRVDLSKRYLQKETVLTSKKFDYASKEELDQFLNLFPNSELAPMVFRLRLEYCRRFRDAALQQNQSALGESLNAQTAVIIAS